MGVRGMDVTLRDKPISTEAAAGIRPYPAYKPSGVPWLGDIPAHWAIHRQRNVVHMLVSNVDKHSVEGEVPVRLCNYVDVYKNRRITDQIKFMQATATHEEVRRFRLQLGDVLITKDSELWNDIGVPALVEYAAPDLVCGYHLAILRPRSEYITGGFLLWALQCPGVASQYHVSANGVTRFGLTHDAIKNVQVPVPPLEEQAAIVRYLDAVDRLIRRYIRAKRRLIDLLTEQKQAIIHQAVTQGLDPSAPRKPSGVEWLGDIPAHWEIRRLKSVLAEPLKYGANEAAELTDPCLPRYIRITDINNDGLLYDETFRSLPEKVAQAYLLQDGDILFARSGATVGKTFIYSSAYGRAAYAGYLIRARFDAGLMNPQFAYLYFNSPPYWRWLASATIQATIQNVSGEKYANLPIVVPPRLEQDAVLLHVRLQTEPIAEAVRRAQNEIELIREYRTRLIADVVTGQLDVRDAPLPAALAELDGDLDEASEQILSLDAEDGLDDGLDVEEFAAIAEEEM